MQNTMELLDKALQFESAPYWHRELKLSRNALHNARMQGHVSAPIAGAMAKLMGENVEKWICIAALESAKDSAVKTMLIKEAGRTWLNTSLVQVWRYAKFRGKHAIQASVSPLLSQDQKPH